MNLVKAKGYESLDAGGYINQFEKTLLTYAETQAKQNGQENKPVSEPELRVLIMNHVETETQEAIEKNKQVFAPISGMIVARKISDEANAKIQDVTTTLRDAEHRLAQANRRRKENCPDKKMTWVRRVVYLVVAFLSALEGIFIYEALRSCGYPQRVAFISSISLALGLSILTHLMARYIKQSETKRQYFLRYIIILALAFIGFYFIGHLRASAYTTQAQIDGQLSGILTQSVQVVSGWGLTIICFLSFVIGLFISVKCAKTKNEEAIDKEYQRAKREYNEQIKELNSKQQKIEEIKQQNYEKTEQVLANFEKALAVEKQLKIIAKKAMNMYTITNIRHRRDGLIPAVLNNPPQFQFTTFFENINNTKS